MFKIFQFAFVVLAIALGTSNLAFARGFGGCGGFHAGGFGGGFGGGFNAGGFHAGGFEGGGYHAGGFDAGGFHAGGVEGGGYHAGGFDAGGFHAGGVEGGGFHAGGFEGGGYHAGGFDAGGFHAGGYGGSLNRSELGGFLHLPTDGGMSAAGGAMAGRGAVAGPEGAAAYRGGATGHVYQGPMGTTVAHGTAGVQGVAAGPERVAGGTRVASGTAVKGPEGNVYTTGGTASRGFAAGPEGFEAGSSVSHGSAVRGPGGNVYAQGMTANRGVAAGAGGVVAGGSVTAGRGYATTSGARYHSPTYYHAQAVSAQHWCDAGRYFTPDWCAVHPWAWCPAGYTAAAWATAAWNAASWSAVNDLVTTPATPVYYDYGSNITYQGDNVYYGSQPVATTQAYYQQADTLANQDQNAQAGDGSKWLPLGMFGLMASGQKVPDMVFQLSVNSAGTIRGNYYDQVSETTLAVHGSIDKRTQRAAWQIGNNKNMVIETGLYNFTESKSTALVHYGPDRSEQFLMVQLKQPDSKAQSKD